MTDTETIQQRWRRALRAARASGVHVKPNVKSCCNSCTTSELLGLSPEERDSVPYAFFVRSQGMRVRFTREGELHRSTHDSVYFNWANGAAAALAKAFRDSGFTVEWDGSPHRSVQVLLREPVSR